MEKLRQSARRKYHFIYKTTNLINQKYYIGMHSTDNLDDQYIGSGTRLWSSINHYGRENFIVEILEFLPDRKSLREREAQIVDFEKLKDPFCMNICTGGEGGWEVYNNDSNIQRNKCLRGNEKMRLLRKSNEEWKNIESKLRAGLIKQQLEAGIRTVSDNFRLSFLGKTHTDEIKKRISEANSKHQAGAGNSQFGKRWMNKDGVVIRVIEQEVAAHELQGWSRGKVSKQHKLEVRRKRKLIPCPTERYQVS